MTEIENTNKYLEDSKDEAEMLISYITNMEQLWNQFKFKESKEDVNIGTEVIVEIVQAINMTTQKEIVIFIFKTECAEINHVIQDTEEHADNGRQRKAVSARVQTVLAPDWI